MTALAQEILHNFDQLPNSEQLAIAQEILKRLINFDFPALTDDDLILNVEAIFLALDQYDYPCKASQKIKSIGLRSIIKS